jgi:hypothetical protein
MVDIPIIFSAPMVRALLEGRKSMTRRVLNRLRIAAMPESSAYTLTGDGAARALLEATDFRNIDSNLWVWSAKAFDHQAPATRTRWHARIPYAVGDRLWVRESLRRFDREPPTAQYIADIIGVPAPIGVDRHPNGAALWQWKRKAIPSIHMPRWASRLTLIVTGVKVERLYDISDDDIRAEGIQDTQTSWLNAWRSLWEGINGPGDWETNPFVVALSFRIIKANVDAPEASAA